MTQLQRSWAIAAAGTTMLLREPKLLVFPLCSLMALLAVLFGALAIGRAGPPAGAAWEVAFLLAPLLVYLLCFFAAMFFNAGLTFCALRAFDGAPASIRAGLAAAAGRGPQLLAWSTAVSTIGFLIKAGHRGMTHGGDLISLILTMILSGTLGRRYPSWITAAYFVLPVLVVDRGGLGDARRRSNALVRQRWGEIAELGTRFGLIGFMLTALVVIAAFGVLVAGIAWELAPNVVTRSAGAAGLCLVLIALVLSTLGAVFTAAVYRYAVTGTAPEGFASELVQAALQTKPA